MMGAVNPRRSDTRRNHERILAVAAESLSCSAELSFNAIAKKAGVGIGTVYRHFPTSEALILAVYQRELGHLVDVVPHLLAEHPPQDAFKLWTTEYLARYIMTKRGLAEAMMAATKSPGPLSTNTYEALVGAVATLVDANMAAGTVRDDLNPVTVLRGLGGLFSLSPAEQWQKHAADLTDLLWRGMRRN
ncbi:TetR/AcrR family transcriptional regulator [Lentzea sp. NPDC059081]|uniref:TetR/AcrR family transcriptional regulator n=1 Tax=Lentzea sp. NPDC059081 TaxID=3346719 RepID=UPI00367980C4